MTTDTTTTPDTATSGAVSSDPGAQAAAGEWFVRAHVEQLLDNPVDVRGGDRDQTTLVEMAASIRDAGVLQALTVVPVPDQTGDSDGGDAGAADEFGQRPQRFVIYAGHRRRDAARLAAAQIIAEALGHDTATDPTLAGFDDDPDDPAVRLEAGVPACAAADRLRWLPCLVRPDLAGQVGMDIAAGLIENDLRVGITSGQRARAAEQLSFAEGWNIPRIASATGLSRAQARAAAALSRLGDGARQATYRGELSLEHVAVLDQLAGEGATEDELGLLARSGSMFDHHVSELGKTLRRRGAAAALLDEADTRGWTLFEEPEGYPLDSPLAPLWSLTRRDDRGAGPLLPRRGEHADPTRDRGASSYATLPDHGVILINDPWEDPRLEVVCADPETWPYLRDRHSTLYIDPSPEVGGTGAPELLDTATDEALVDDRQAVDDEPVVDGSEVEQPEPDHDPTEGAEGDDPIHQDDPVEQEGPVERDEQAEAEVAAAAERARVAAAERARVAAEEREQERRAEAERQAEQRRVEAAERAAENERREAELAAAQARRDALDTAAETRWRHTAGMLRTQKGAGAHAELPIVVLARFPMLLADADYFATQDQVLAVCADPDRDPRTGVQRWSPGRTSHRGIAIAAWLLHQNLTAALVMERALLDLTEAEPALWWLDYLTAQGYQPAEIETQARGVLAEIVTEGLAAEYGTDEDSAAGPADSRPGENEPGQGEQAGGEDAGEGPEQD